MIIDGTVKWATGHTPADFVAGWLEAVQSLIKANNKTRPIAKVISDRRYVIGYTTTSGQSCYRANPNQNWSCIYSLEPTSLKEEF